ncbi:MAG: hypothetical protein QNK11_05875 [Legionella sp.]|nr:hypothetical protein [Legionella sp.]
MHHDDKSSDDFKSVCKKSRTYEPPELVKLESVEPESGEINKANEATGGLFSGS